MASDRNGLDAGLMLTFQTDTGELNTMGSCLVKCAGTGGQPDTAPGSAQCYLNCMKNVPDRMPVEVTVFGAAAVKDVK